MNAQAKVNNAVRATAADLAGNKSSVAISEVCGVLGGVLGGVAALANGSTVAGAVTGGIVGAVGGYGMGAVLSPSQHFKSTGINILAGVASASFGITCAQLGAMIGDSFSKLGSGE